MQSDTSGATVFRWIAVLPAALLAGFAGYWIVIFALSGIGLDITVKLSGGRLFVVKTMASLFSGVITVYSGAKVAPNNQQGTAIVIGILFALVAGAGLYASLMLEDLGAVINALAMVVGLILGVTAVVEGTDLFG